MEIGGDELYFRGVYLREAALDESRDATVGEQAQAGSLCAQLGQLEAGVLKLGEFLAEDGAGTRVSHSPFDHRLDRPCAADCLHQAPAPAYLSVFLHI